MRGAKVIVVTPDSSKDLKERVYRFRYQIYVEEMKINVTNEERMLHDKYDDYSTNFILEVNGEDVATIRHTTKRDGPLDFEQQQKAWRKFICSAERDPNVVCELTRVMVKRGHRATRAALTLMRVIFEYCVKVGTFRAYGGGRVGRLSTYWSKFGARECTQEPLPYILDNKALGLYKLVLFDFGAPWSLQRAWAWLRYVVLIAIAVSSLPLLHALLGGRRGYKHQS